MRRRISLLPLLVALAACAGAEDGGRPGVQRTSLARPEAPRSGSGFALAEPATVMTAWHVVRGCAGITVSDGRATGTAVLAWHDARRDLARLHVEGGLALAPHAPSRITRGASVIAMLPAVAPQDASALRGTVLGPSPASPGLVEVLLDRPLPAGASGAPLLADGGAAAVLIGRWSLQQNIALASPLPDADGSELPSAGSGTVVRVMCGTP